MSSKAASLRRRAESDPRALVDEIDEINDCLTAAYYDERRHATSAARKVAYVAPEEMTECVDELAEIADDGRSTSIRKDACRALGHIGRVDGRAVDALAKQQRTATDREVRSTAATARNSLARASLPESADTSDDGGDTDVFDPDAAGGSDTDVYDPDANSETDVSGEEPNGGQSDTDVYGTGPGDDQTAGHSDVPNFCSHCGTDLRETSAPNFCPHCGTEI
ncbi:hypothetical protein [Halobellus marinus]|uniref:hypothetical protein n=1 Tax=Halobellus TaxID=1073986 RepID=UPI0028B0F2E3|nr:hypothetical protein [Halobellus sp. DFY28]